MNCTFFGHKNAPPSVIGYLEQEIVRLINEGVAHFFVGNNGCFDYYAQATLQNLKSKYESICSTIVLSRLDEAISKEIKISTIFPAELATALPRFAISKGNEWLIKNCDLAIVYLSNNYSNTYKWANLASKRGVKIIYLHC